MGETNKKRAESSNIVLSALVVMVLALGGALLLLFAFVIWFSELLGSLTLSLLITGGVMASAAYVTYQLSLSPHLRRLRSEYEQFIGFVQLVKCGYDCLLRRVMWVVTLFSTARE